jgi:hypothetical protein
MTEHTTVVDLSYGDAGKGSVVDWLCSPVARMEGRPVHAVVRFNGGAQAAHRVVSADGRQHVFSQFGSGTFWPGVQTHLSRFVLVEPLALAAEAEHLATLGIEAPLARITVDRRALLTTPVPPGGEPGTRGGPGPRPSRQLRRRDRRNHGLRHRPSRRHPGGGRRRDTVGSPGEVEPAA